ncbi:site-specific integrase [Paraburkholderia azotifigens]|uniref:tyrosine-type recombinase/integrase n=1 Tax=Paraburkholderia azotifigens TaxID=2057004 RepID=UPI0031706396
MATFTKRTHQNGAISYQAKVRRKGFKTRSATFSNLPDAKAWAKVAQRELDRAEHFGEEAAGKAALDRTTLGDLLLRYKRDVTPQHRGWKQEISVIKNLVAHPMAGLPLSKISASVIAAYRDERLRTAKPGTVIRSITVLNMALNKARNEWELPVPPIKVAKPKSPPSRDQVLSPEDEVRLLAAASTELQWAIILALETAARQGELLNLRWRDVDLKKRVMRITEAKNGHPRSVPLSSRAVATLEAMPRGGPNDWVLAHWRAGNSLRHVYLRLKDRLGIECVFHSLRHTCLTRLAKRGLSAPMLQVISGHKSLAMLSKYLHVDAESLVDVIG